jgi:hypothetical protein
VEIIVLWRVMIDGPRYCSEDEKGVLWRVIIDVPS